MPTLRRPLPSTHKERVAINTLIIQYAQKTPSRILSTRELNPSLTHIAERLVSEDARPDVPRRDDIDSAAVEVRRPAQRVHDAPRRPLGRRVLRSPRAVEEGGARPDEDEARVLLRRRGRRAVLPDKVVECELGCVQCPRDVHVCDAEVGPGGFLVISWGVSVGGASPNEGRICGWGK